MAINIKLANTVDDNNPNIIIIAKNDKHDTDNTIIPNTMLSLFTSTTSIIIVIINIRKA